MKTCFQLALAFALALAAAAKDSKPAKPELGSLEPRAVQSGTSVEVLLRGKNLLQLKSVQTPDKKIKAELLPKDKTTPGITRVKITVDKSLPRGTHELWVKGAGGESNRLKLHIDDLPQVFETPASSPLPFVLETIPASCWGTLALAGEADRIAFHAKRGRVIILDLRGKSLDSKANDLVLALTDSAGRVLARGREGGEPFLAHTIPAEGTYIVNIVDQQRAGSANHFYRLTLGSLPFVTGFFPRTLQLDKATPIELIGYNLPSRVLDVAPKTIGDFTLPLDPSRLRFRMPFKASVSKSAPMLEPEPNNHPPETRLLKLPIAITGRVNGRHGNDTDSFRFAASKGKTYVLETKAARSGSPMDTHIEVLTSRGQPILRATLQAVRDSAVNFRPINSTQTNCRVDHWEEMELNEFLYLDGEVTKLFRAPRGPDSGFEFYKGVNGQRRTWFGTSGAAHAKDSPCYIVRPIAPGAQLVSTGLPVFRINYENDDDGWRQHGTDSRLHFTAPATGEFVARIQDSRGRNGERFTYVLTIREAQPGFKITLEGTNPSIAPGTGKGFAVKVDRTDGFDGAIRVDLPPAPKGFHITTPLIIQAGHNRANGTVYTANDAPMDKPFKITGSMTASATIAGKKVVKTVNAIGTLKAAGKTDMFLGLETAATLKARDAAKGKRKFETKTAELAALKPLEITIAPGETLPLWLAIQRAGRKGIQKISIDNLPHGIIIDNIGLNGVEIAAESDRREIFLACSKWVPETDRLIFAANGKLTSLPVLLKVRRK